MLSRSLRNRCAAIGVLAMALFVASAAGATSTRYFTEVLTSTQARFIPTNTRITLDTSTDHSIFDVFRDGTREAGAGLGDGYVSGPGDYIVYEHHFTPAGDPTSVLKATLAVGVLDDQFCDSLEKVEIRVDGSLWKSGIATINLFGGSVTAYFGTGDEGLSVAVISRRGDFNVIKSVFGVEYLANDVVAVPEPGAALLFCAGALVVSRARRSGAARA